MRLLKVYLLISMGKCISWYVPTVTHITIHHYPQIIDLFICNSLIGHIGWRGRKSRGHTATPFIAQIVGKTCTFQVRVSSYNFAANHQTFTITNVTVCHSLSSLPIYVLNYIPFWSFCSMEIMKSDGLNRMATMIMAMICLGISQCSLRWTLMVTTVRKHQL